MKALVLKAYKQLEVEEVERPTPGAGEALVRVRACGICGSDVHGMDGSSGRRQPPIIMGHEAAGTIEETGADVAEWRAGDRVTFDSTIYCGECFFCLQGRINLCDNRRVLGVSCDEYRRHGAFAEYVAVPQHILYRLPENLSFEQAAMVEPVSVAVHAIRRTPVVLNDSAVVVGAGVIGLLCLQALRAAGCGKVAVIDVDTERLGLAEGLGANLTLNPRDGDPLAAVHEWTKGRGADVAVEAVGLSETVLTALRSVRKGGSVTLVGNLQPKVELALQEAVTREISLFGACASSGEYPACLELMASGAIQVAPLLSATAPLEEGAGWFDRLYRKEPGLMKVVLQS